MVGVKGQMEERRDEWRGGRREVGGREDGGGLRERMDEGRKKGGE